jgi:hypothetical protein
MDTPRLGVRLNPHRPPSPLWGEGLGVRGFRLIEVRLEQGKVDADERGQAESLVLELVLAGDLCLSVVVHENESIVRDQFKQPLQRVQSPVTVQESAPSRTGKIAGKLAVRDLIQFDRLIGILIFGSEKAVDFTQGVPCLGILRLCQLLELFHGQVREIFQVDIARNASAYMQLLDPVSLEPEHGGR